MKSGLDIENPCPEKWENMLPVKDGAFCKVCNKNVIDFTSKTNDEIKAYVAGSNKKVCGKLKATQLLELNFDGFFSRFRLWNLTRRLAVVFFFGFGMMLFSCGSGVVMGDVQSEPVGKVAVSDTLRNNATASDTLNNLQDQQAR